MAMNLWEVSDAFWSKVEPLIPRVRRDSNQEYQRRRGAGRKLLEERRGIAVRQGYKARRWIVEVAHSWFNRFRKLLVRFEKTHAAS